MEHRRHQESGDILEIPSRRGSRRKNCSRRECIQQWKMRCRLKIGIVYHLKESHMHS
ncbi:unnamed protein product [Haemonchus placei]|uniref:Uncharacterized protein n=1 Tax=Haemonchus placei TaxID=6290 RepID=A0A3P7ZWS8_HAEPC|nr:unnamed protein product [Haemonchus placei]